LSHLLHITLYKEFFSFNIVYNNCVTKCNCDVIVQSFTSSTYSFLCNDLRYVWVFILLSSLLSSFVRTNNNFSKFLFDSSIWTKLAIYVTNGDLRDATSNFKLLTNQINLSFTALWNGSCISKKLMYFKAFINNVHAVGTHRNCCRQYSGLITKFLIIIIIINNFTIWIRRWIIYIYDTSNLLHKNVSH